MKYLKLLLLAAVILLLSMAGMYSAFPIRDYFGKIPSLVIFIMSGIVLIGGSHVVCNKILSTYRAGRIKEILDDCELLEVGQSCAYSPVNETLRWELRKSLPDWLIEKPSPDDHVNKRMSVLRIY